MITRREAVRLLGSASAAAWFAATQIGLNFSVAPNALAEKHDSTPPLAPGAPNSPERIALIEAFNKQSEGLDARFEAYTQKADWIMPYRLFRPEAAIGKLPLVVYLHGSGGLGDDNLKQLAFGNVLSPANEQGLIFGGHVLVCFGTIDGAFLSRRTPLFSYGDPNNQPAKDALSKLD